MSNEFLQKISLSFDIKNVIFRVAPELFGKIDNRSSDRWNSENGYDDSTGGRNRIDTYPYRVFGTGPQECLYVSLAQITENIDYLCRFPIDGFKVILHSPAEIPQPSAHYFHVAPATLVSAAVKPHMIGTSKELQSYPPTRKLCYYSTERKLRFFKIYTQRHCELECQSNYTLKQCDCVLFWHPRKYHAYLIRICNFTDFLICNFI